MTTLLNAGTLSGRVILAAAGIGLFGQTLVDVHGDHAITIGAVAGLIVALITASATLIATAWWLSSQLQAIKSDINHIKENCPRCLNS